jgi:hypothetical protein
MEKGNEMVGIAIARSHHERWDGTGYPDRLKGEEIPLAARFVGPKLLSFSRVPVQIKQLGNKIGGTGRKTLKSFHIEKNQVLDNTLI